MMIESFLVGLVTNATYDLVRSLLHRKNWKDPQLSALMNSFREAARRSIKDHPDIEEISPDHFMKIIRDNDLHYVLAEIALVEPDSLRTEIAKLCSINSIDQAGTLDFFYSFFKYVREELEISGTDENSPIATLVALYNQQRQERKIDQVLSRLPSSPDDELRSLKAMLTEEISSRIMDVQSLWERGDIEEAYMSLNRFREEDDKWERIAPDVRAKWLRTEATLRLELHADVETAEKLREEAQRFHRDASENLNLRVLIEFVRGNYERALDLLPNNNPTERIIYLRAALLLEMEELNKAEQLLAGVSESTNVHIHYLRARLSLRLGDIQQATRAILNALEIAPQSDDMRFWFAQLKYLNILAPAIQPRTFLSLPEPVPLSLVRMYGKYRESLHEATEIFNDLRQNGREDIRPGAQIWYLACLLTHPELPSNIMEVCEDMASNPDIHPVAGIWMLSRGINVKYDKIIDRLETRLSIGQPSYLTVSALVEYYLRDARYDDSLAVIERNTHLFPEDAFITIPELKVKTYLLAGRFQEAHQILSETPRPDARGLEFLIALREENTEVIETFLDRDLTDESRLALHVVEYLNRKQQWSRAIQHVDLIVREINTDFAFDLGVQTLYYAAEPERCLDVISRIEEMIHPDRLPLSYENLRCRCLLEVGEVEQAYTLARTLFNESPGVETFMTASRAYQYIGDIDGLTVLARDSVHIDGIPSWEILRVAQIVSITNIDLAVMLWRNVNSRGRDLEEDAVLGVLLAADMLGTKSETAWIADRMQELAANESEHIQLLPFNEEGVSKIRDRQAFAADVLGEYLRGRAYVHMTVEFTGASLVEWYHDRLTFAEENGIFNSGFALVSRHGARSLLTEIPRQLLEGHLGLDITSLLLLEHFELLKQIEKCYSPIHIPQTAVPALLEMLLNYHRRDRERVKALQRVNSLTLQNRLRVVDSPELDADNLNLADTFEIDARWLQYFQVAEENKGYLVSFLPLKKRGITVETVDLPKDMTERLIDLRSVVDALHEYRIITRNNYNRILHELGTTSESHTDILPPRGASIIFYANTLEIAAAHGILDEARQIFDIVLTSEQKRQSEQAVRGLSDIQKLTDWISSLTHRIFTGLKSGTYRIVPIATDAETPNEGNLFTTSILSLIQNHQKAGDVLVCDDRFINSHVESGPARILGSTDLMRALVEHGEISPEDYWQLLARFRQSNIRFLPYTSNEIIYHLVQGFDSTSITIHELPAMRTMRDYVHACVTQLEILQAIPPEHTPNQPSEKMFLVYTYNHILEAIHQVWSNNFPIPFSWRASEWILDCLYLPNRSTFLDQDILEINEVESSSFPEVYNIRNHLPVSPDSKGFSRAERFGMWFWHHMASKQDE